MMSVPFHPEADCEMEKAVADVERANPRSAIRLVNEINRALDTIERTPKSLPLAEDAPAGYEVRYVAIRRFKFRVVFWLGHLGVIVVAVAHFRQRPGYWNYRLSHFRPPGGEPGTGTIFDED